MESTEHCFPHLLPLLDRHDGFLVACFSDHPLVGRLSEHTRKPVIGILQAGVTASLQLISRHETFGIISTGHAWEKLLTEGVFKFIGVPGDTSPSHEGRTPPFAGVETTGLNATDLHDTSAIEVRQRIKQATCRLLNRDQHGAVGAICLGCAGMVGMEDVVREACMEKLGDGSRHIRVIDGVRAGVGLLQALVAAKF